ncbi:MAG: hypothetical protein U0T73_07120 [Chitinophagales bacterium]
MEINLIELAEKIHSFYDRLHQADLKEDDYYSLEFKFPLWKERIAEQYQFGNVFEKISFYISLAEEIMQLLPEENEKNIFAGNFLSRLNLELANNNGFSALDRFGFLIFGRGTKRVFIRNGKRWRPNTSLLPQQAYNIIVQQEGTMSVGPLQNFPVNEQSIDDLIPRGHEKLRIGLFPLKASFKLKFKITQALQNGAQYKFRSIPVDFDTIKPELDIWIREIKAQNIQMACFPELSICDQSFNYLKTEIKKLGFPFFILIAGSFHRENQDKKVKNTMPVYIFNENDTLELEYHKKEIFSVFFSTQIFPNFKKFFEPATSPEFIEAEGGAKFFEDIDKPLDDTLLVLKSSRFGNIGFCICKDFIDPKLNGNLNKRVQAYADLVDHMVVVSMNADGPAGFRELSTVLARPKFMVSTFYVNSRAVDLGIKSESYIAVPYEDTPQFVTANGEAQFLTYELEAAQRN